MVARGRYHVKKGTDMNEMTGGRAVVEVLKAEGVRHIFGIVGATFLDVLDALYDDRRVEYINVRHEQAAAFMADGLARVTGQPGVCLVTSGPGATNLLTGDAVGDARAGRLPHHSPADPPSGGDPRGGAPATPRPAPAATGRRRRELGGRQRPGRAAERAVHAA